MRNRFRTWTSIVLLGAAALFALQERAEAGPVYQYVGSWIVGDGPFFGSNPLIYSGRTAAAFLFGGNPTDYAISTVDDNPANINFKAFLDGWDNDGYLFNPADQDYSLSAPDNGGHYNRFPSFSAFVLDHSCYNRYTDLSAACSGYGTQFVNYAFRIENVSVPEPASLTLFGFGLIGLCAMCLRKVRSMPA